MIPERSSGKAPPVMYRIKFGNPLQCPPLSLVFRPGRPHEQGICPGIHCAEFLAP